MAGLDPAIHTLPAAKRQASASFLKKEAKNFC
jgi:hypothetical protein